jgi:nitrite reductase (NADH) small subunit/3-phenylpropionate/trans-cinnamate dioxygenase ferredoxin subunit
MKIAVAQVGDLADGESLSVTIDGRAIGLFFSEGRYFALEDRCPHAGSPLTGGPIDAGVVTCPWHFWRFRLADGLGADFPKAKVACFPVEVVGEQILVDLPEPAAGRN